MSSLPVHLKVLLKNLKFISMIEKGKKPCLSDLSFVDSSSWFGAWKRNRNSEDKKHLKTFIDSVVEQSFKAIEDSRNKEYAQMIIKALDEARNGIINTQVTYKDFPDFITDVGVIIDSINHQLNKYVPAVKEEKQEEVESEEDEIPLAKKEIKARNTK